VELTALPRPLSEFKGLLLREGREGVGKGGQGKGREWKGGPLVLAYTPDVKSWIKLWYIEFRLCIVFLRT